MYVMVDHMVNLNKQCSKEKQTNQRHQHYTVLFLLKLLNRERKKTHRNVNDKKALQCLMCTFVKREENMRERSLDEKRTTTTKMQ